ncbi:hypothetical protein M413DRAFT_23277 [Hebeloma cylindrosporum]|uniref:Uncharacterized protein n=1 Tax=Hebeloma cylindrosporum TaxID=76867 RepID=A0A0C3CSR3_HEBCY|nr:hypothetical protein M413DRAFT_23277 [Hebeloma cylindrosporum h7]
MVGYELDLKSFGFQKLMETNAQRVTADMFSRVLPVTEASGATAISTRFSLPSILNFNHFSYLNSTLGILPVVIDEIDSKIFSESGTTIPVNVKVEQNWATPPGFPVSFSMSQQGFTAQVTCQQRELDASTKPSLVLRSQNDILFNTTVTLAQLEVVCPTNTQSSLSEPILTSVNVDAVFAISCPVNQINGRKRWDLILTGSGIYKEIKTTICSIYPQVHAVTIDYNDDSKIFNSSFPNFINGTEPLDGDDAPWVGEFALSVFLKGLNVGQSTTGSAMGDTILSFVSNLPNDTDVLSDILAQYVRGVLELSVTLLRTVYTQNGNGLYPGGESVIPPSMRIATNGTYAATTVGWHQATETAGAKGRNKEPETNRHFDPGSILHIISAASAGGMQTPFPPFHENKVHHQCENVMITLAPVNGGSSRPGFINLD